MSESELIEQINNEINAEVARARRVTEKLQVAVDRAGKVGFVTVRTELLISALDVLGQQKAELESLRQSKGD